MPISCVASRHEVLASSDLAGYDCYLFADAGTEPRGRIAVWNDVLANSPGNCVEVTDQARPDVVSIRRSGRTDVLSLQDEDALKTALMALGSLCVDISGLGHHVWAPIIKVALRSRVALAAIYAEPSRYRPHSSPAFPDLFDLSVSFDGLAPLPGFARLQDPPDSKPRALITFLGFEGMRPSRIALATEPQDKVIAIVGVPGFRVEYPTLTLACNGDFLHDSRADRDIRLAPAHCPCGAYETLSSIRKDYPDHYLYLAPVGTKPHALGAVCYAIDHPLDTELLYDHPKRRPQRTEGVGPMHIYALRENAVPIP